MTTSKPNALSFVGSSHPFTKAFEPRSPFEVPRDAPEGSYTYALVQSGPAVPAGELEAQDAAVEVMIRWGATVLHVAQLAPVRSFWVGEGEGKGDKSDFFLPEEKLGARRLPLVLASGGAACLVIPAGATGTVTLAGEAAATVGDLVAAGKTEPCDAAPGARRVALPTGSRAELEVNGFTFQVSAGQAGKRVARGALSGESLPYQGLSLLFHAALLGAAALFVPAMAMADEDGIPDEQRYEMMQMLSAQADREPDATEAPAADATTGAQGDAGKAAGGEMGKAGSSVSRDRNRRFVIADTGPDKSLSRAEALQEAENAPMIGLIRSLQGSMSPPSPWGREIASGFDHFSANGNIWGNDIGDAAGSNGLNLSGLGEGGGRDGVGVGVGDIGTIGHDFVNGHGHSIGRLSGVHQVKSPSVVRMAQPTLSGRLPPEIIQRVVRQNFGRFKACYESGLRSSPNLQGRVAVRFVIGRDGAVSNVGNGGSDMPDAGVVSCVIRSFYGLSFPQPENGIVTVTYPIVFSPGN